MMPRKSRTSSARFAVKSGLVERMTAFDSFPLGQPAFVTHILDRAAHLRRDDAKLLAMEGQRDARAYLVHRDSLVMKPTAEGPRALLTIDEALTFGANPGTIFLGLRDGAPVFGHGHRRGGGGKTAEPRRRRGVRIARYGDAGRGAARPAFGDRDGQIDGRLASAPRLLRQLRNPLGNDGRGAGSANAPIARPSIFPAPTRS